MLDLYNQYTGDPGYLPKDIARYQAVTVTSVKQLWAQTFGNNQRVVVITVPGKKVTDDVPRSPEDTDANVKIVNPYKPEFETQQDWRKTPPTPGKQPELNLPVPSTFALANGTKVYLLEDHSLPVFSARLVDLAGSAANPTDQPGLAAFTARMLTEGTAKRSSTLLADDVASIGASLNSTAGMDASGAAIDVLSNNTDAAFDLLSDVAMHPAFKAEEVERIRAQRLTSILQEGDQPFAAALRVGETILFGNYPYGYRDIGTTASVKAITRDQLAKFWSDHYAPASAALVLVGDINEAEARKLGEQYFESWSAAGAAPNAKLPPMPAPPTRKIVIVDKPGAPQTALLAFGEGVPRSTPEYAAIDVMNSVLGGLFSNRINMNLREKNGYTYGAFSQFGFYRDGGIFYCGAQVRTDVTAPAAKELFGELNRMRTDPPTPAELKLAEDSELHSLPGQFETVEKTAILIGEIFTYNLPTNYYQALPSQYLKLTPDAVEKTAIDYVHPENLIVVAVGDRAKIESGLGQLNLGPIEIRNESGDLVKK